MYVEYLDWSDHGHDKQESGLGSSKFAELTYWTEDTDDTLVINLRRKTKTRKDLTVFLNTKELYKYLKDKFEE